jgi:hypothetical protein
MSAHDLQLLATMNTILGPGGDDDDDDGDADADGAGLGDMGDMGQVAVAAADMGAQLPLAALPPIDLHASSSPVSGPRRRPIGTLKTSCTFSRC